MQRILYTFDMDDFTGVKIALLLDDKLLMIERDNKPGINFPGLWDFPGGARDDDESALECITRELEEELAIRLNPNSIIWKKKYPAMHDPSITAYFMVAKISEDDIKTIKFGNEGRGWKLMPVQDFLAATDVVMPLKGRLQDYLSNDSA